MYLISYDIEGNSLRTKISDKLIAEGLKRIQYSVFLGVVSSVDFLALQQWLTIAVQGGNTQKDTVLIIHLTKPQIKSMTVLGFNKLDIDELTDSKSTFVF